MQEPLSNGNFSWGDLFKWDWDPAPINAPTVDPDIRHLDPLSRSAEAIRYSVLSIEFWISPTGKVREWLRNNTRLGVLLAVPGFLVMPIITFILWQTVSWLSALALIARKLIVIPILGFIAAAILRSIPFVLRILLGR